MLVTAILVLSGCAVKKEEQPITQPSIPVVEPTQEMPASGSEAAEKGKALSEVSCVDGNIQAKVTNTGAADAALAKEIKVLVNGLLVVDPECDKATLAAGESTLCTDLSGHLSVREGKLNTVQINLANDRAVEYVMCTAK